MLSPSVLARVAKERDLSFWRKCVSGGCRRQRKQPSGAYREWSEGIRERQLAD